MWCGPGVGAGDRSGDHWQCGGTTGAPGHRTRPRQSPRSRHRAHHSSVTRPQPHQHQTHLSLSLTLSWGQTVDSWGPVPLNICQLTKVWRHNKNRHRKTLFTVSVPYPYLAPSRSTHCHVIKARKENIFSFYSVNKKAHRK